MPRCSTDGATKKTFAPGDHVLSTVGCDLAS